MIHPSPTALEEISGALDALRTDQRQLDQDGVFVGVSRQALDEVLTHIAALEADYRRMYLKASENLEAMLDERKRAEKAEAQLATRLPDREAIAAKLREWAETGESFEIKARWLHEWLLSGAATPAPTLTEEAAREYAELRPVSAEQIIRWWEEDKRRRAQGFKDDNWSRLLLSILHAFKDLANRDAKIAQLTVAPAPTAALTEEERKVMGTLEEAQATLLEKWRVWTQYTGPTIADRKTHRERDAARREAEVRLREAAATVAWHLDRAKSPPQGAEE